MTKGQERTYLSLHNSSQTVLRIYVQPGAKKNEMVGLYGEPARLKIRIKAPPVDGEANLEVIAFISKILGTSKNKIEILRGEMSRQKDLLIDLPLIEVESRFLSL